MNIELSEDEKEEKNNRVDYLWKILNEDLDKPFLDIIVELVGLELEIEKECNK